MSRRKLYLTGTLILFTAIFMAVYFPLQGSRTSDILSDYRIHPAMESCLDSPNCLTVSTQFSTSPASLFEHLQNAIKSLSPTEIQVSSTEMSLKAVFQIPVFGFKDDVEAIVEGTEEGAVLHLKSSSRIGYSDLGVNRRRVKKIIRKVESHLIVQNRLDKTS